MADGLSKEHFAAMFDQTLKEIAAMPLIDDLLDTAGLAAADLPNLAGAFPEMDPAVAACSIPDWHNQVPGPIVDRWKELSDESRLIAYVLAKKLDELELAYARL
jgi:hypothetical protein